MTTITNDIPVSVSRKLNRLRTAVRTWLCIQGLSWLIIAAVITIFADLAIDRFFRLDVSQRVIMLIIMFGGWSCLAWLKLIKPLMQKLDADALCLRVESEHDSLNESLISAVQLSRIKNIESLGASPSLIEATITQGVNSSAQVDFTDVLDTTAQKRHLIYGLLALLIFCGMTGAFYNNFMKLYFQRNFAFSAENWPQDTKLHFVGEIDGVLLIPRGDDYDVRVRIEGVTPSTVVLYSKPEKSRSETQKMISQGEDIYSAQFRNVLETMKLRAKGGDGDTGWIEVQLVDRPELKNLTLTVTPPKYTNQQTNDLPPNRGAYDVLIGSSLQITGEASTDLSQVTLILGKNELTKLIIDKNNPKQFTAKLTPDQLQSATFSIMFHDQTGLGAKRPARFSVRMVSDTKPLVRAKLIGISDMITTRAIVPIECRMSDDFAIADAALVYQDPIADLSKDEQPPTLAINFNNELVSQYGKRVIDKWIYKLDVEQKMNLEVGQFLHFWITATDNDGYSGAKTGKSASFSLKVVTDEELRAELLRQEQEQRMEFESLLSDQRNLMDSTNALLAGTRSLDQLDLVDRKELGNIEKKQRLATSRFNSIANQFKKTLAQAINNRLEAVGGPMERRMNLSIISPMRQLADFDVIRAADALDYALKTATPTDQRDKALEKTAEIQKEILAKMKKILTAMVKMEGYQQAINLMRQILKNQNNLNEQTIKALEEKIKNIFDE